jgi:hypothetical protein
MIVIGDVTPSSTLPESNPSGTPRYMGLLGPMISNIFFASGESGGSGGPPPVRKQSIGDMNTYITAIFGKSTVKCNEPKSIIIISQHLSISHLECLKCMMAL